MPAKTVAVEVTEGCRGREAGERNAGLRGDVLKACLAQVEVQSIGTEVRHVHIQIQGNNGIASIGTLSTDCRISGSLGDEFFGILQVWWLNHDAWGFSAGRIRLEQLRGFQTTLAGPYFPHVDNIAWTK